MKLQNERQLHAMEKAIDKCNNKVWLESAQGEYYDLKDEMDRYKGLARLMSDDKDDDLGLYTSSREDMAVMLDFCLKLTA